MTTPLRPDAYFDQATIREICEKKQVSLKYLMELYISIIKKEQGSSTKKKFKINKYNLFIQQKALEGYCNRLGECVKLVEQISNNITVALLSPEEIIRQAAVDLSKDPDFFSKTKIEYEIILIEINSTNKH